MQNKRPNILFIMSDDHAAHALSCYQSKINSTRHLDRIANEGVLFKNCFCTNSICEPSRAAILTGTYNHINGVTTIGAHLDNRRENAAKILQQNGYQTAAFGKWHLGEGPEHCPAGFDEWKVLIGQGEYFNPVFIENGKSAQRPGYATDIITDLTMDYIRRRKKDRPFFVQCHHKAPHRPWEPNHIHKTLFQNDQLPLPATLFDDYSDRSRAAQEAEMRIDIHMQYRDLKLIPPPGKSIKDFIPHPENTENFFLVPEETREKVFFKNSRELKIFKYQRYIKDYLRCIASIDENTGRLLDFLKDEKILDDTVIIYTSDQGFFLGDHGWYDKRFMYEESLRMPYIMRYPRAIKAGTVIDEITTNVDFAPTWLDFAGIPRPDYYQGYSQRPLLNGIIPDDWQQSMYYRYWMHLGHYVSAHYGVRTRDYKLIYYYGDACGQPNTRDIKKEPEWELFDLKKDPAEIKNVYHDQAYRQIRTELKNELHRLQKKVKDTPFTEIE